MVLKILINGGMGAKLWVPRSQLVLHRSWSPPELHLSQSCSPCPHCALWLYHYPSFSRKLPPLRDVGETENLRFKDSNPRTAL